MADFTKDTFKTVSLQDMIEYIEANVPKDKKWFKAIAFDTRKTKVAVPITDKDGKPVMYQEKDKSGNLKFKDGKPVMRQKIKMVEKPDGEEKNVFNLLKAKKEFFLRYFPQELPTAEKKAKPSDLLKDW